MIELHDITQHYGVRPVLRGITLRIERGEVVVILGPNGMGKTTLLGVMAGVLSPQKGEVFINGLKRRGSEEEELAIRRMTVYLPDQPWLPAQRTAREFLLAVGRLYDVEMERLMGHADQLLHLFDLSEQGDTPIRSLSAGQKKKVALCSALVSEAPVLLLDEPFSGGLDPSGIMTLKRIIQHHQRRKEATIVLTSPVPELVEDIATRIIVIHDGEVPGVRDPRRPPAPDGSSRRAGPGAPALDLPRHDPEARQLFPGVRPMIRRMLRRLLVVAPSGWPVILFVLLFASVEGPIHYLEWQVGQPIVLPYSPGRWFLIAGAVLLARYRVTAFHPLFHADYLAWLKSTPWTVDKSLPVGPIELVPQDALAMGGLMLLGLAQRQTESIELLIVFLFAYLVWILSTFWRTRVPGFGYVAALLLGFVPRLWNRPWLDLAVLTGLYLLVHEGLWRSLSRFPWATEGFSAERTLAVRQEEEFGPACGWPYDRFLRDVKMAKGIRRADALLISMLVGWWLYALEDWISSRFEFPMIAIALFQLMMQRGILYFRGYAPPISVGGRIATFRWIIAGYDRAIVFFVLAFLAFPVVMVTVALLGIDPRRCVPLIAALVVYFTLSTPPSLRNWRLTGQHRLVAAIPRGSQEFVQVG